MRKVYLDRIAGTPLHPRVKEAMLPYLGERFGNPQNLHSFGQTAAEALEAARARVAALINAEPSEIYFTSSGTESNNFALKGMALAKRKQGKHIVVSEIEHLSVLNSVKSLERLGYTSTQVPVDQQAVIDPDEIQPHFQEIAEVCRQAGVVLHTDAVAAAGVIPVDVQDLGVQALSLAGNQFYGPNGSAALYVRKGTGILPLIDGGIQERGKRAGSENLPGIVGLGEAAEIAGREMENRIARVQPLRDRIVQHLSFEMEHVVLTGHPVNRLPHHASFCVAFVEGEAMLLTLDMQGIAVSSGSACSSKSLKVSHVLLAMGMDHALAQGSLVFSLIDSLTQEDIDYFIEIFSPAIERLRKMSPLYTQYLEENNNDVQ